MKSSLFALLVAPLLAGSLGAQAAPAAQQKPAGQAKPSAARPAIAQQTAQPAAKTPVAPTAASAKPVPKSSPVPAPSAASATARPGSAPANVPAAQSATVKVTTPDAKAQPGAAATKPVATPRPTPAPTTTSAPAGKSAAPAAGRAGRDSSRATSVAQRGPANEVTFSREVFSYERSGRRDPFVSLLSSGELRPIFSDLKLVAVAYDPTGRNSVAVMRDITTKDQYRVKLGQTLGRMRVNQIQPKSVTFTIEEFGYSRQEVLALGDSTKARTP